MFPVPAVASHLHPLSLTQLSWLHPLSRSSPGPASDIAGSSHPAPGLVWAAAGGPGAGGAGGLAAEAAEGLHRSPGRRLPGSAGQVVRLLLFPSRGHIIPPGVCVCD